MIEQWLKDAIRDYSTYFPRTCTHTITTTAEDRTYDLPTDFIAMLSVEYPAGEETPEYLTRRAYTHEAFWGNNHYDILARKDDGDAHEIWIGPEPEENESITIEYTAHHDYTLTSSRSYYRPGRTPSHPH